MNDNFPQDTIILSLWYDNPIFPTWQRSDLFSSTVALSLPELPQTGNLVNLIKHHNPGLSSEDKDSHKILIPVVNNGTLLVIQLFTLRAGMTKHKQTQF